MAYVIPGDTQVAFAGNPPGDANNIADMLGLLTRLLAQLHTGAGAADPAGNAANVTALQAIITGGADLGGMTALGDMIYENATPAPARLAGNTTAQLKFLGQAGTGSVSAAPAWSVVPGQVLAVHQYAPGTLATLTLNNTTFAAFDSTNAQTGSFTAPPSGNVLVTASFVGNIQTATTGQAVALAAHGTVTPIIGNEIQWADSSINVSRPYRLEFYVTGLTPGAATNFDLVGATGSASDAMQILAQALTSTTLTAATRAAPLLMTVTAMP